MAGVMWHSSSNLDKDNKLSMKTIIFCSLGDFLYFANKVFWLNHLLVTLPNLKSRPTSNHVMTVYPKSHMLAIKKARAGPDGLLATLITHSISVTNKC